jgi:glycosyltransferase involved in cell wall biosynthesis
VLLSAALIVRDEERFLGACLASLSGRVDEIVIVDTGSADRSIEIAHAHRARVIESPWIGDFAAARNIGLDAARGEWILYIDADERVVGFDRAEIEKLLSNSAYVAHSVLFRPSAGFTQYREFRLFRNRPDVRFKGVIHETMLPDLETLRACHGLRFGESSLAIDHDGYGGDQARKHVRNLPLLLARLQRDPHHVYSQDHLGRTLLGLSYATDAERAFRAAINTVRASAAHNVDNSTPYLHLASFLLDRKRDAMDVLDEAAQRFPGNHAINWLRARALVDAGRYEEAMPLFDAIAQVEASGCLDSRVAYDISIFGAAPRAAMGLCALKLGRFAEAVAHYTNAEEFAPEDIEIRTKRRWAETLLRRNAAM